MSEDAHMIAVVAERHSKTNHHYPYITLSFRPSKSAENKTTADPETRKILGNIWS